jgi:hypothetical protein
VKTKVHSKKAVQAIREIVFPFENITAQKYIKVFLKKP